MAENERKIWTDTDPINTADVQRWEDGAYNADAANAAIAAHKEDGAAHKALFAQKIDSATAEIISEAHIGSHNSNSKAHKAMFDQKLDRTEFNNAAESMHTAHNSDPNAHKALFDSKIGSDQAAEIADAKVSEHNSDTAAHSALFEQKADISKAEEIAVSTAESKISEHNADKNAHAAIYPKFAPCITETATGGAAVRCDNISPLANEIDAQFSFAQAATSFHFYCYGKNLLNRDSFTNMDDLTSKSTAYQALSDGVYKFTVSASLTGESKLRFNGLDNSKKVILPPGRYKSHALSDKQYCHVVLKKLSDDTSVYVGATPTRITEPCYIFYYQLYLAPGTPAGEYTLYPQLELGSEFTGYEPFIEKKQKTRVSIDGTTEVAMAVERADSSDNTIICLPDEGRDALGQCTSTARYAIDTKTYIDRKFAELQAAVAALS